MPRKQYNFQVEEKLLEKLRKKAKIERRSVNQIIEFAAEEYVKDIKD